MEEAGQEKIEFNSENALMAEQPQSLPVSVEETNTDLSVVLSADRISEEITVQESPIQIPAELSVETVVEVTKNVAELATIPKSEISTELVKATIEEVAESVKVKTSATEDVPRPKLWKIWKEKIQGFIKKLFA